MEQDCHNKFTIKNEKPTKPTNHSYTKSTSIYIRNPPFSEDVLNSAIDIPLSDLVEVGSEIELNVTTKGNLLYIGKHQLPINPALHTEYYVLSKEQQNVFLATSQAYFDKMPHRIVESYRDLYPKVKPGMKISELYELLLKSRHLMKIPDSEFRINAILTAIRTKIPKTDFTNDVIIEEMSYSQYISLALVHLSYVFAGGEDLIVFGKLITPVQVQLIGQEAWHLLHIISPLGFKYRSFIAPDIRLDESPLPICFYSSECFAIEFWNFFMMKMDLYKASLKGFVNQQMDKLNQKSSSGINEELRVIIDEDEITEKNRTKFESKLASYFLIELLNGNDYIQDLLKLKERTVDTLFHIFAIYDKKNGSMAIKKAMKRTFKKTKKTKKR